MNEIRQPNTVDTNLFIKVFSDGISYAFANEKEQMALQQEIHVPSGKMNDIHFFERFFEQPELLVYGENVSIVFENSSYLLIPSDLFQEKDMRSMYELEFGKDRIEALRYSLLPKWGIHLAYGAPEPLIDFFEKKYPDADIEHHIFKLLKRKIAKNFSCVYANVRKNNLDLIVVQGNALMLANSFQINANEDICYYVLNVYDVLELDTTDFPLKILSDAPIDSELASLLKLYVFNTQTH